MLKLPLLSRSAPCRQSAGAGGAGALSRMQNDDTSATGDTEPVRAVL